MEKKEIPLNFDGLSGPEAKVIAAVLERAQKIRGNPVVFRPNDACAAAIVKTEVSEPFLYIRCTSVE